MPRGAGADVLRAEHVDPRIVRDDVRGRMALRDRARQRSRDASPSKTSMVRGFAAASSASVNGSVRSRSTSDSNPRTAAVVFAVSTAAVMRTIPPLRREAADIRTP